MPTRFRLRRRFALPRPHRRVWESAFGTWIRKLSRGRPPLMNGPAKPVAWFREVRSIQPSITPRPPQLARPQLRLLRRPPLAVQQLRPSLHPPPGQRRQRLRPLPRMRLHLPVPPAPRPVKRLPRQATRLPVRQMPRAQRPQPRPKHQRRPTVRQPRPVPPATRPTVQAWHKTGRPRPARRSAAATIRPNTTLSRFLLRRQRRLKKRRMLQPVPRPQVALQPARRPRLRKLLRQRPRRRPLP